MEGYSIAIKTIPGEVRIEASSHIKIRKGLDLPLIGEPEQVLHPGPPVHSVALCGRDFVEIRPKMRVKVEDRVRLGQPLFVDRRNPRVPFVSPGSGVVKAIHYGPRRVLQSLVVELEGADDVTFQAYPQEDLMTLGREAVRENLLASGLWTALRARPCGGIPQPETEPHSIFVVALDTQPLAAHPRVVVDGPALWDGLRVLSRLTEGAVYLCRGPDLEIPDPGIPGVQVAVFEGPHPAGLVGTHIHFLDPVGRGKTVWYLDYQDAMAIGRLFRSGRLSTERVITLAGPLMKRPRLLRTRLGASARDLVRGELEEGQPRIISGSVLSGRRVVEPEAYLGRYHSQLTVIPEGATRTLQKRLFPGDRPFSVHGLLAPLWQHKHKYRMTAGLHGEPSAMVPIGSFERVMPLDILPGPLLRALLVGDTEQAEALGCLELEEEDLSLCTFLCPSKLDYGPLLRSALDRIERERRE